MIDFHTHLGGIKSTFKALKGTVHVTADDLLEYMDDTGVEASVVLPTTRRSYFPGSDIAQNEEVFDACARYHDRLIPFCAVDPRDPMAPKKVERCARRRFRGFGEHKIELRIDDSSSKAIYRICGELGLPVLLHMDDMYNRDIEGYEGVVAEFSDTTFIAHGPGWWKEISAEVYETVTYPKGKVIPGGRADHILQEYPNAYADISATSGLNALQRDEGFTIGFVGRNWRKLLFGTDFPCLDSDGRQFGPNGLHINLLRGLGLSEEVFKAITHDNAERLLKSNI